jgi:iron complex outermembrane recepter protein
MRNERRLFIWVSFAIQRIKVGIELSVALCISISSFSATTAFAEETVRKGGEDANPSALVDEVVVTGTHIRGASLTPSSLFVIERVDIERSGYGNISELVASLTQSAGGGASQTTGTVNRNRANFNTGQGTGVNLRGLGTGATLTLLNGNRLSPSGQGTFVDISLIPLSAVERIEILTDAASAVYGSDAVGGVVNVITRKDFSGLETIARVGTVTSGSRREYTLAQLMGYTWGSGNVTVSLEHTDASSLRSADRSFIVPADGPHDLMPSQTLNSLVSSLNVGLTPSTSVNVDIMASKRHYDLKYFRRVLPPENSGDSIGLSAAAGLDHQFGATWLAQLIGTYSRDNTKNVSLDPSLPVTSRSRRTENEGLFQTWSSELRGSGSLFVLPAGDVRLALGMSYRSERQSYESATAAFSYSGTRDIKSSYAEVSVPVLGSDQNSSGQRVTLSAAGRIDEYSDVGRTTNPRIAMRWDIVDGFVASVSYGRSFRAPLFVDTITAPNFYSAYVLDVVDPRSVRTDGRTTTLTLNGPNANLKPERARSWSAGLEAKPTSMPGLSVSLNYFDIEYVDRVLALQTVTSTGFLVNESAFGAFVERNPSTERLMSALVPLLGGGFISNFNTAQFGITNINALIAQNTFGALFDGRTQNAAESSVRGVDFGTDFTHPTDAGDLRFNLSTTYLLEFSSRFTSSAPSLDQLNTVFNPLRLRIRTGLGWGRGPWNVDGFLNFANSYKDPVSTFTRGGDVSSWSTVDGRVQYEAGDDPESWLNGLVISLNAINVLDRRPPKILSTARQPAYDQENANPLGRFIALNLSKRW